MRTQLQQYVQSPRFPERTKTETMNAKAVRCSCRTAEYGAQPLHRHNETCCLQTTVTNFTLRNERLYRRLSCTPWQSWGCLRSCSRRYWRGAACSGKGRMTTPCRTTSTGIHIALASLRVFSCSLDYSCAKLSPRGGLCRPTTNPCKTLLAGRHRPCAPFELRLSILFATRRRHYYLVLRGWSQSNVFGTAVNTPPC